MGRFKYILVLIENNINFIYMNYSKVLIVAYFLLISNLLSAQQTEAEKYFGLAKECELQGDQDKALELYSKLLEIDSNYQKAYFNRAAILSEKGNFTDALSDLYKYDKLDPFNNMVTYLMAICYYYINEKETAFLLVNLSLDIESGLYDAHKLKATLLLENSNYELALEELQWAMKIRQDDKDLIYLTGFCFEGLREYENALVTYLKALDFGYQNEIIYNNIGNLYNRRKEYAEAILFLEKAVIANPTNGQAYYNLFKAYSGLNKNDEASKYLIISQNLGFRP
jgi:tetratricopeptide (TPR) repeat protein